jgi:tetratricopeptide (TPR) repeat protein
MKKSLVGSILGCFVLFFSSANEKLDYYVNQFETQSIDQQIKAVYEIYFLLQDEALDSSLYYINKLHATGVKEARVDAISMANFCLGHYLTTKLLYDEGLEKFKAALETFELLENDTIRAEIYNGIGNNYYFQGDYNSAEQYYLMSFEIGKNTEESLGDELVSFPNLARIYIKQKKFIEAEELLDEYIQYHQANRNLKQLGIAYGVKGQLFLDQDSITSAMAFLDKSMEFNLALGSPKIIANGFTNMAIACFYGDKIEMAESYFRLALSYRLQDQNKYFLAEGYYNMGDYFFELEVYDSCIVYYLKSLETADSSGNLVGQIDGHFALAETYEKLNDLLNQNIHLKKYIELKEKQFEVRNKNDLLLLRNNFNLSTEEANFKQGSREDDLHARMAVMTETWNYWIWIMIGSIIVLLSFFLIKKTNKRT